MNSIVGVRFKAAGKIYYFDPKDFAVQENQAVIVETVRGLEYGEVVVIKEDVPEEELKHPLKPVIRLATPDDTLNYKENIIKQDHAKKIAEEKINDHQLEMKLLNVEYTFDGSKVVFYFTADGRVDFRELVKDLASVFKTRIELRQVGVRDEAKQLGGLGCCGREFCCSSWIGEFAPVSIKMAKDQNLSLNPTKISGVCGRLMCCLNYEVEAYKDLKKTLPRAGERVIFDEREAVITDVNLIAQKLHLKFGDGDDTEYMWVAADEVRRQKIRRSQ